MQPSRATPAAPSKMMHMRRYLLGTPILSLKQYLCLVLDWSIFTRLRGRICKPDQCPNVYHNFLAESHVAQQHTRDYNASVVLISMFSRLHHEFKLKSNASSCTQIHLEDTQKRGVECII